MNAKELLLVRLGREFGDLPEAAVVEVVTTLALLHTGPGWRSVEDQARDLLTTIRCSTRRPSTRTPLVVSRRRAASRSRDTS